VTADRARPAMPLVWRVPPWQPALLNVVAAVLLLILFYRTPSAAVTVGLAAGVAIALTGSVLAMRFVVIAGEEGVVVRRVISRRVLSWSEIVDIESVAVSGVTMTVRLTCTDKSVVDVPPTLVQPTLPTNVRKAHAVVYARTAELAAVAAAARQR
jgi:hypothetical protein